MLWFIRAGHSYFYKDNWFKSQDVSVTAIDDLVIERDHTAPLTHLFSSSDERFEGLAKI